MPKLAIQCHKENSAVVVVSCQKTGFINVTPTIDHYTTSEKVAATKGFGKWIERKETIALVEAVQAEYGIKEAVYSKEHEDPKPAPKAAIEARKKKAAEKKATEPKTATQKKVSKKATDSKKPKPVFENNGRTYAHPIVFYSYLLLVNPAIAAALQSVIDKHRNASMHRLKIGNATLREQVKAKDDEGAHNYVVMSNKVSDVQRDIAIVVGKAANVRSGVAKRLINPDANWKVELGLYHENLDETREKAVENTKEYIKKIVAEFNKANADEAKEKNEQIKKMCEAKKNEDKKNAPSYAKLKITPERLSQKSFPVKCAMRSASYIENKFMSYNELLNLLQGLPADADREDVPDRDDDEEDVTDAADGSEPEEEEAEESDEEKGFDDDEPMEDVDDDAESNYSDDLDNMLDE